MIGVLLHLAGPEFGLEEALAASKSLLPRLGYQAPIRLEVGNPIKAEWQYPGQLISISVRDKSGIVIGLLYSANSRRLVHLSTEKFGKRTSKIPVANLDRYSRILLDSRNYGKPDWRTPEGSGTLGTVGLVHQGKRFFNVNPPFYATFSVDDQGRLCWFAAAHPIPPGGDAKVRVDAKRAIELVKPLPTADWKKADWKPEYQSSLGWYVEGGLQLAVVRVQRDWFQLLGKEFPPPRKLMVHRDVFLIDQASGKVVPAPNGVHP